jgi:multidrug transporter EmrE-like cation transporter
MKILLIIIYVVLTLSGLVLMKKGGNPGKVSISKKDINLSMSPVSALGFVCYLCSFLLFTKIVVMFDLSYIMPIVTGVVQVMTLVVANIVFKEKIDKKAIIGASLVILGIVVMNLNII